MSNSIRKSTSTSPFDVGVMGFWYSCNYGSMLTYYALNNILKDLGKSVLMIDKPLIFPNDIEYSQTHSRIFSQKHYNISKVFKLSELGDLNSLCSTFMLGSDQLWNYGLARPFGFSLFFDFVDDDKRKIACATSFGHDNFSAPDGYKEHAKILLEKFDAISVREDSGVTVAQNNFGLHVEHIADPIFMCDMVHYENLIASSQLDIPEDFILVYILDATVEKRDYVLSLSKTLNKKVICIVDGIPWHFEENNKKLNLEKTLENVHVEDFLYCFKKASFIVTDSFHGVCFSIVFCKQFICLGNKKRGLTSFTSLLEKLELTSRMVLDNYSLEMLSHMIDYDAAGDKLNSFVRISMEWLKNALDTPVKKIQNTALIDKSIFKLQPELCTGCGACSEICPHNAIEMKKDEHGFLRARVKESLCINCGMCGKRCIALNPQYKNIANPKCYAMMAKDETRKISSSGGMFTVAAEYILNLEGYVCGAAYTDTFEVKHIVIDSISQLGKLRGSKYMQSEASPVYPKIKELLEKEKYVLFSGMPCQVAGLYAYLGRDYEKLYTLDIFCHGIASSKVFKKYHHDILNGKKLTRLEFKAKEPWGWYAGMNAYFEDGTKYSKGSGDDPYFKAYLQNIAKNSVCGVCKVNTLPRQGDLSIGDFWRVSEFDPSFNDNKGTSVVLVNNAHGESLFDKLKDAMSRVKEAPLNIAIKGNNIIKHPYPVHKNRNIFFENLDKLPFDMLQSACSQNRIYEQIYLNLIKTVPKEDHEFYLIAKVVATNFCGRKVVTWIRSEKFETILRKYFGLTVAFGVSQRKEAQVKGRIEDFSILNGKSSEYYLVSLDRAYDDGVYNQLAVFGYREKKDFVFRKFKPLVLEHYDLAKKNYYDDYGNSIEGFNTIVGKVIFRGFNNHIMLDNNITHGENITVDVGANAFIDIGEGTRFNSASQIEAKDFEYSMSLVIGRNCIFNAGALFRFFNPSSALINESCTSSSHFGLHANQGKKIIIGRDCMFSYENELWAGDGHSVFDVKSGKCTNRDMSGAYRPSNHLVIGDHVWLGKQAFIMHGSNIGSGSIVGARSVVKGVFPNNCSIAGNPAARVKEDVAWSRDGMTSDIRACGRPEYAALTSHAHAPISGRKVLVIGGTRFMGIQLVRELIAKGNEVTIATRGKAKDSFGMAVNRLIMDVADAESTKAALREKYFDVVFDNLAYCSAYINNILSSLACGKYIQLSSIATYAIRACDMKEDLFDPYRIPVEICDTSVGYGKGKRQAEAFAYQHFKYIPTVTVRLPYVAKTDRLYYYCKCIVKQLPMKIEDVSRGFTFVQDHEVGKFLPWLAAQEFTGPINLASEGMVTIQMILDYIESKTKKQGVIDVLNGSQSPFNEKTFSLNMDKAKRLGYKTSNINSWFWKLMDEYLHQALKSK
ncbi:polysaccharide pyruvyl transferase family protein [uncultured Desulfovibrio sp.]|uniref:polysaccharide pyruvyl transferase family protein n=1 Tax=uncultured Desulfovibrio sp. TaxID=167968 RepID=UPI0025913AF4|nr:polysaccharide pyruvyl transferase family protein [uncultured Desulfovibrio sp.]